MKEAVQDIVDEMREGRAPMSYKNKFGDPCDAEEMVMQFADRLEAAISPSLPAVCVNCRNYDARRRYCPTTNSMICKGIAKKLKARGCDKWVAK